MDSYECDVCEQPARFLCSKCGDAVYCSEACQAADWAEHAQHECFTIAEMSDDQIAAEFKYFCEDYPEQLVGANITHPDDMRMLMMSQYDNIGQLALRKPRKSYRRKALRSSRWKDRKYQAGKAWGKAKAGAKKHYGTFKAWRKRRRAKKALESQGLGEKKGLGRTTKGAIAGGAAGLVLGGAPGAVAGAGAGAVLAQKRR